MARSPLEDFWSIKTPPTAYSNVDDDEGIEVSYTGGDSKLISVHMPGGGVYFIRLRRPLTKSNVAKVCDRVLRTTGDRLRRGEMVTEEGKWFKPRRMLVEELDALRKVMKK